MEITINSRLLRLVEGDITEQSVDAIVNAANQHLQLGSGVAGAIRVKGGSSIQRECDAIGHCPVGRAVLTGGGVLKAKYVIHAVGPHGGDSDADKLLKSATRASLELADQKRLASIAFPAISTGVFSYPISKCASLMLATTVQYLGESAGGLMLVIFCLFGLSSFGVFSKELERYSGK